MNSSVGSSRAASALGTTVCPRSRSARGSGGGSRRSASVPARFCASVGVLGGRAGSAVGGVGAAAAAARPGRGGQRASRPVPARSSPRARLRRPGRRRRSRRWRRPGRAARRPSEPAMPARGQLVGRRRQLAHDQRADGHAQGQPEQPAHQAARRRPARAPRSCAARPRDAWPSRRFSRAAHAVAERGHLDQRAAQRGGDDAGQRGGVARHVGGVAGDVVDLLQLAVDVRDRRRAWLGRQRSAPGPCGWPAWSRPASGRA